MSDLKSETAREKRPIAAIMEQLDRMFGYVLYENLKSYIIDASDWTSGNKMPNSITLRFNFRWVLKETDKKDA